MEKKTTTSSPHHIAIKIFFGLCIIFFVFSIALCITFKDSRFDNVRYGYAHSRMMPATRGNSPMMYREEKFEKIMPVRLFGNITKVEGNQVIIMSNAAKEQLIISAATTMITASSTEVGVSALKVGQNIVSIGVMNKENQLEAKLISIFVKENFFNKNIPKNSGYFYFASPALC